MLSESLSNRRGGAVVFRELPLRLSFSLARFRVSARVILSCVSWTRPLCSTSFGGTFDYCPLPDRLLGLVLGLS